MTNNTDMWVHGLAGAGAGVVAFGIVYPLTTISTTMQVQSKQDSTDGQKNDTISTLLRILQHEGLKGLYSGISSGLFAQAATQGVYYYFYELIKKSASPTIRNHPKYVDIINLLIAAGAGCITVGFTNPIWVVNTRMTLEGKNHPQSSKKKSMIETFSSLIKEEGLTSLWKGVIPALILVSNPMIQFTVFERLKLIAEKKSTRKLSPLQFFFLGAIGKIVATFVTYPYILIKSRLQMKQGEERYKGTFDVISKIGKYEGIQGFYKGISSRLLSSVLNAAFLFATKEEFSKIIFILLMVYRMKFNKSN